MSNRNPYFKRFGFFPYPSDTVVGVSGEDPSWNTKETAVYIPGVWDNPSGTPLGDISVFAPARTTGKGPEHYYALAAQIRMPEIGSFPAAPGTITIFSSPYGGVRAATTSYVVDHRFDIIVLEINIRYGFKIYDKDNNLILSSTRGANFAENGISSPSHRAQNDGVTRPYSAFNIVNTNRQRLDPRCYIIMEVGIAFNYLASFWSFDPASAIIGFGDSAGGDSSNEFNLYKSGTPNDPPPNRNCGFEFFGFTGSGVGWQVAEC